VPAVPADPTGPVERHAGPSGAGPSGAGPSGAGPWWQQRQLDPASPAWLPADLAGRNRTGRRWTVVGVPEAPSRWLVDPCGLLVDTAGRWALDWWIGAEDRWHVPGAEPATRQRLVDDAPVVETLVRVPGGDVVVRHWGVPAPDGDSSVAWEIANTSAAPVAVAVLLRAVGLDGPVAASEVRIDADGLTIDGVTLVRGEVQPRQSLVGGPGDGDVAATVLANATPPTSGAGGTGVTARGVGVTAAMIWPLAHRATLRGQVVARETPRRQVLAHATRRQQGSRGERGAAPPVGPAPDADATARGWAARCGRATRFDLPPGPLASALHAQRPHLLLARPDRPDANRPDANRPVAARVVAALATAGLRDEAGAGLEAWLDDQHHSGLLGTDGTDTAATLWALAAWARTGPDDDGLLARSPIAVARAAECVDRRAGSGAVATVWAAAGLRAAATLLRRVDEPEAAGRAATWAATHRAAALALLAPAPPGRPDEKGLRAGTGLREETEAALLAVVLGVVPAGHDVAAGARRAAVAESAGLPDGAIAGRSPLLGASPELTLLVATAAASIGDPTDPWLRWVLGVGGPTWTWPSIVHPRLGTGSHGDGHDPAVAAAMWGYGRTSLVVEDADAGAGGDAAAGGDAVVGLAVAPVWPEGWLGLGVEVHGLATAAGPLSYALRWHGDRPALLWEIGGDGPAVALRCGLDASWRSAARRGEALLAPVAGPGAGFA
jgi:hypothetical protein